MPPPDGRRAWRIGLELQIGNQSEPQLLWTKALATDSALDQATPSAAQLVLHKIVHQPGRDFPYTFTITNISQQPLFYGGYAEANSPPLYMTAERHWGRWIDTGHVDWSGTNFGFKKLSPGKSISFSMTGKGQDAIWRVGIRFYHTPQPVAITDAFSPVWCDPLPRSKATGK